MKVLYDHQAFTGKRYGGISRYFYELMSYYADSQTLDFDLALAFSNNAYLEGAEFSKHHTFPHFLGYTRTNRLMSLMNRRNSTRIIKAGEYDLFHPTFYHRYFLDQLGSKPFVLTFHDCTSEKFHHLYPSLGGDQHWLKQHLLQKATRVIAISHSTKNDLLEYFDVDESKVDVIYHCTNFSEEQVISEAKIDVPEQYLLFVGDRLDYKNFDLFIKAITPLLKKEKDLQVVCAGGRPFTQRELAHLTELDVVSKVRYHEIYDDATLGALYKNATAFAFPSLNEGFGLPILEAFAFDCPVLVSDNSCFPEIAGDAARYFDPTDAESMLASVEEVLGSTKLRQQMTKRGAVRLRDFSKETMALQTLDCYKATLSEAIRV